MDCNLGTVTSCLVAEWSPLIGKIVVLEGDVQRQRALYSLLGRREIHAIMTIYEPKGVCPKST